MIYGFTGTSKGMTGAQIDKLMFFLKPVLELHHGDCVGADEQAHKIAKSMGIKVIVHPPTNSSKRAFCHVDDLQDIRTPKPYLQRNADIVLAGVDGVIGTPRNYIEPASYRGEGTWTTISYARKARRALYIIYPDGSHDFERGWR